MKETAALQEQIMIIVFCDPGATLKELHAHLWARGGEIRLPVLGSALSNLKKQGILRVRRFKERPGEVRYNLTRAGIEEAVEIMNGTKGGQE